MAKPKREDIFISDQISIALAYAENAEAKFELASRRYDRLMILLNKINSHNFFGRMLRHRKRKRIREKATQELNNMKHYHRDEKLACYYLNRNFAPRGYGFFHCLSQWDQKSIFPAQ